MRRYGPWLILLGGAILALGWWMTTEERALWWESRPLTDTQRHALGDCAEVQWITLVRALRAGHDIPCGADWVVRNLERSSTTKPRRRSLRRIAESPALSNRSRAVAGLALLQLGESPSQGLSQQVFGPRADPELESLAVAWLASEDVAGGWEEPLLARAAQRVRLRQGDETVAEDVLLELLRDASWGPTEVSLGPLTSGCETRACVIQRVRAEVGDDELFSRPVQTPSPHPVDPLLRTIFETDIAQAETRRVLDAYGTGSRRPGRRSVRGGSWGP